MSKAGEWKLSRQYKRWEYEQFRKLFTPYHVSMQFKESLHVGFDANAREKRTGRYWSYRR